MTKTREHMELEEAVKDLIRMLQTGPFDFSTGVCCCGDEFDSHSGWENHSYTDEGQYAIDRAIRDVLEKM